MEILVVLGWLIWASATAIVAAARRRSSFGWFLLGLLFPIVSLIVLVAIPAGKSGMKTCPHCAEAIQEAAVVCRFCSRDVPPPEAVEVDSDYDMPARRLARAMTGRG